MAVLELESIAEERGSKAPASGWPGRLWRWLVAQHEARQRTIKLARMSPHQLRDMGFDPEAVYGAVEGSWDEVRDRFFRYGVR